MKKFSFKSEFQELEIDLEIGKDIFEKVIFVENDSSLIEGNLTYFNILRNILRKEERKEEILESFKVNIKPEDIIKIVNEIIENLQGKN